MDFSISFEDFSKVLLALNTLETAGGGQYGVYWREVHSIAADESHVTFMSTDMNRWIYIRLPIKSSQKWACNVAKVKISKILSAFKAGTSLGFTYEQGNLTVAQIGTKTKVVVPTHAFKPFPVPREGKLIAEGDLPAEFTENLKDLLPLADANHVSPQRRLIGSDCNGGIVSMITGNYLAVHFINTDLPPKFIGVQPKTAKSLIRLVDFGPTLKFETKSLYDWYYGDNWSVACPTERIEYPLAIKEVPILASVSINKASLSKAVKSLKSMGVSRVCITASADSEVGIVSNPGDATAIEIQTQKAERGTIEFSVSVEALFSVLRFAKANWIKFGLADNGRQAKVVDGEDDAPRRFSYLLVSEAKLDSAPIVRSPVVVPEIPPEHREPGEVPEVEVGSGEADGGNPVPAPEVEVQGYQSIQS